ncbi:molybdopterin-guanine dinucleotide biosynthesis protein B [Evansella sp. LMS18]|jgi:molybdopterin-guanine dinucleotide biosynthesis protein B|uniref:molybdopterin-guanine dinucleotide biosynthesis protein B n=1 Tax=Evansella sp. LMS18 TaxID=2924033 RepID=UPI0020D148F0|nr:molybdopterin-guanine dinucleotide biosynthesis protein B [Evansella sp. LMS18]UTR11157.1 molybdopterin-guanine dinucleotide biosynthesis protein B [Evansella sp. LMS18]
MRETPFIFQIAGYSNSGKTTLVKKWLKRLSEAGIQSATIKHHGHGGKLKTADTGKDSAGHREAGSSGTIVASGEELQFMMKLDRPLSLEELINFYKPFSLDIIIIEGFKKETYPKLLLLRNMDDLRFAENSINVEAVVCWNDDMLEAAEKKLNVPVFCITEENQYLDWLTSRVNKERDI